MPIELIIFDLDGTLVDTCEDLKNALNYCLKRHGIKEYSTEEVKGMIGEGVRRFIEKALENRNASLNLVNNIIDCFVTYYSEHISDYTKPYPGVIETLKKLRDIKKAVISNKLTTLSVKTLSNLGLSHYFDLIAGNDFFHEQKPSAVPIIKTIEKFNTKRENTLMVGDSNIDIDAGRSAGIKTVGVTYGYKKKEMLKGADYMIDKFEDLIKIIEDLNS